MCNCLQITTVSHHLFTLCCNSCCVYPCLLSSVKKNILCILCPVLQAPVSSDWDILWNILWILPAVKPTGLHLSPKHILCNPVSYFHRTNTSWLQTVDLYIWNALVLCFYQLLNLFFTSSILRNFSVPLCFMGYLTMTMNKNMPLDKLLAFLKTKQ